MTSERPLLGILGGGQLGLMLGEAAHRIGVDVCFVDPSAEACAAAVGPVTVARWDDVEAITSAFENCDALTYEWEGVPAALVEAMNVTVEPGVTSLRISQDRLLEKGCFEQLGITTAAFRAVKDTASLAAAVDEIGGPGIVKTRFGGYDGKGQVRIAAEADPATIEAAWEKLAVPSIYERMVEFDFEFSIVLARDRAGNVEVFDPIRNDHSDGILRLSRVPAGLPARTAATARAAAITLTNHLEHVGALTLECFATSDGFVANEFAPRVHNSGHWTIEGAPVSQFEQHVRAVIGMPLLPCSPLLAPAAMRNCIGRMPPSGEVSTIVGAMVHDYGKAARFGRKVGHVTMLASDDVELDERLERLDALISDEG